MCVWFVSAHYSWESLNSQARCDRQAWQIQYKYILAVPLPTPTSLHVTLRRAPQGTLEETHPSFSPLNKGQHFIWLWQKVCVSVVSNSHGPNHRLHNPPTPPLRDTWDSFWPSRPRPHLGCTWLRLGPQLLVLWKFLHKLWFSASINSVRLSGSTGSHHSVWMLTHVFICWRLLQYRQTPDWF